MESMLEQINIAALKFLEPISVHHTYSTIVDEAIKVVGGESGLILLDRRGTLKTVYASREDMEDFKVRKRGFAYQSFSKRKTLLISSEEFKDVYPEVYKTGIKWVFFIPLSYKNKSIGVLVIRSRADQQVDLKSLQAMKLLGSMATLAIRNIQLYEETREALELRDDFIALAAHELRTPLTTMYGYIQLLNKRTDDMETVEAKWIQELGKQSRRINSMVEELLQMNRIKAGKVHYVFEEQNVSAIINHAIAIAKRDYPEAKVTINSSVSDRYWVIADEQLLTKVFVQVLENALKFSPDAKNVDIEIWKESSRIFVRITDYGVGIARRDIPYIFDDFYKSDSNLRKGMGIGLFIAKEIILKHKGTIKVRSKLHKGTSIEISVPYRRI